MESNPQIQQVLIARLEALSEEEVLALDRGIDVSAAKILAYKVLPELAPIIAHMSQFENQENVISDPMEAAIAGGIGELM